VEALTRSLAEDLPLSVLLLTDHEEIVRHAAGARWEERGYDVESLVGRHLYELLPEDMHGMVREHYEAAARGEVRRFALHYGPGYRATLVPVRAADGTIAGALALAFDEGEELRAEKLARQELSRRLAQQAAVARLGELALRRVPLEELEAAAARVLADNLDVDLPRPLAGDGGQGYAGLLAAGEALGAQDHDFLTAVAHVLNGAVEGQRTEERIRHDALHDALTGLPNRALLMERLSEAIASADAEGRSLALFFLDVDHLKVLNDSLGHKAGDELLRAIGPRLRAVLRPEDMIARFGGDEFAVLCERVGDEAHALRVAERLVRAFAHPFEVRGEPRFCSTSVGVVVSDPAGPRGADELLSDADAALYRAKERGRGRHEVFDAGLRDRTTARLQIEDDLRRALQAGDQLWVAYQPYYALPDERISGVEALLRWDHPERGAIPPSEFIPVAEDSGLIVDLGELVLRTACRDAARWPELSISVNVSARQMELTGMPGVVGAVLRETGLEPERLALEITEGLLLEDTPAIAETLQALRRLGMRLMLDDFGTGYSSLAYLRRHPIDALKIDRAFVADLGEDGEGDAAIVQAIIGMAKALGMRVVPEGVETAGQLRRLTALECDFAQGFHLSRPLPASGIGALLG